MRTERPGKGPGKKPHPAPRTARYHVTCHVAAEISAGAGGTTCLCTYTAGSTTLVVSHPHNVTFSFANSLEMADILEIFKCCYIFASVCLLIGYVGHLLVPRQICLAKKMAAFSFFARSSRYLRAGSHRITQTSGQKVTAIVPSCVCLCQSVKFYRSCRLVYPSR